LEEGAETQPAELDAMVPVLFEEYGGIDRRKEIVFVLMRAGNARPFVVVSRNCVLASLSELFSVVFRLQLPKKALIFLFDDVVDVMLIFVSLLLSLILPRSD
jgi:hypothetical protein